MISAEGMTTPSPVRTTKHPSSFTSNGTSSWSTDTTVSTTESGHFLVSTVEPNATLTTLQPKHTSHPTPLTSSSSAPSVGNASTFHASTIKSTDSLSTTPGAATRREGATTVITQTNIIHTVTTPKGKPHTNYSSERQHYIKSYTHNNIKSNLIILTF